MSLSSAKQEAINDLVELMADMRTREVIADEEFATRLIGILFKWITKSDIKYISGLVAGSNNVTGTFNGEIE